eukprot:CAMPEP_0114291150 /NCGR_PEP_ID=MMETSP0059-20121206/8328_1 /TAXON_ID=36894 /ORGANISM="Pyramimonas parkeae, Strain CCMP726" /LENGTH=620 /DNA_ID=CAMNT_0001412619 /DNA_START=264 /DNA_END=2126 /DNA_ORIENTATION=+
MDFEDRNHAREMSPEIDLSTQPTVEGSLSPGGKAAATQKNQDSGAFSPIKALKQCSKQSFNWIMQKVGRYRSSSSPDPPGARDVRDVYTMDGSSRDECPPRKRSRVNAGTPPRGGATHKRALDIHHAYEFVGSSQGSHGSRRNRPIELLDSDSDAGEEEAPWPLGEMFKTPVLPSPQASIHPLRHKPAGPPIYVHSKQGWVGDLPAQHIFLEICLSSEREVNLEVQGVRHGWRDVECVYVKFCKIRGSRNDDGRPGMLALQLRDAATMDEKFARLGVSPCQKSCSRARDSCPTSSRCITLVLDAPVARAKSAALTNDAVVNPWKIKWKRLDPARPEHEILIRELLDRPGAASCAWETTLHRPTLPTWWCRDATFPADMTYPYNDVDAVTVTDQDMTRLCVPEFLNDTIIDMYLKYLETTMGPEMIKKVHFFNSFFFKKLLQESSNAAYSSYETAVCTHERVKNWTSRVDIFSKEFLFIPVHSDLHWSLAVICNPGVDSTHKSAAERLFPKNAFILGPHQLQILHLNSIKDQHANLPIACTLRRWLVAEWGTRNKLSKSNWYIAEERFDILNIPFRKVPVPQQRNATDCGLFVLHQIEKFCDDPTGVRGKDFQLYDFEMFC